MEKREYIIRMFARTKKKDYENYILNRLWNKLDMLELKPVTQQYVKRADGKYALLDLYFPQLHIGIECDEEHHKTNQLEDMIRTLEITKMFDSIREDTFTLYRVDASLSLEKIHLQIDAIVEKIRNKVNSIGNLHWDTHRDMIDKVIERQSICVRDNYKFNRIIDAMRIFGKDYQGMQRSYFRLEEEVYMWFPALAIRNEADELISSNHSGWVNSFNHDWSVIYEGRDDDTVLTKQKDSKRIVFMKIKDDIMKRNQYQFVGVFVYDHLESTNTLRVFNREADELCLERYLP